MKMRRHLVSSARCAIRMRSRESDTKKALTSLRKDLANGLRHCSGIHSQCNPDFCTTARGMVPGTSLGSDLDGGARGEGHEGCAGGEGCAGEDNCARGENCEL